ncbi:hypothetical protein PCS70012_02298, partial [Streptococcus pneumoniae PCS70012]
MPAAAAASPIRTVRTSILDWSVAFHGRGRLRGQGTACPWRGRWSSGFGAGAVGLDGLPGLARGDEHRVPHRGERRGVGEVDVEQLFHRGLVPQRHGEHVDALGRAFFPDDLGAEQPSGAAFGDEFGADGFGPGVVAGPGGGVDHGGDGVEAGRLRFDLAEAGASDFDVADLGHGGAEHPGEGGVAAAEVDPGGAALLVRVGTQRQGHVAAGDAVELLHAVPAGPHPLDAGAQPAVHGDRPRLAQGDPGVGGQGGVRGHPQAEDHQLGGDGGLIGDHGGDLPGVGLEA